MNRCLVAVLGTILVASIAKVESDEPRTSVQVLAQARTYNYQFRTGKNEVAPLAVALLEEAVLRDPRSTELWNALGVAYFLNVSSDFQAAGNFKDVLSNAERAKDSYEKALQIDPNDAFALAGRGMARSLLANRQERAAELHGGVADMDRAVELDPGLVPIRLMRAFTTVNLAPEFRSIDSIADDLQFLITVSAGNRAADVLRVLLGDAYMEAKDAESARRQYAAVADTNSFAGSLAQSRLLVMQRNGSIAADAEKLRNNLSQCTMCHGG
jgi:tetratricopeptide (TPR) repeat protein